MTCDRSVVFSGTAVSFANKTGRHDITDILLKVALHLIHQDTYYNHTFCPIVSVEESPSTIPALVGPYLRNDVRVERFCLHLDNQHLK